MTLITDVQERMEFGRRKYGHGVCIGDNMTKYTRSKKDCFLEMQKEEILDGIIYTTASYLRWINDRYDLGLERKENNNEDIKSVLKIGVVHTDAVSLRYKDLLDSMKKTYRDTKKLCEIIN